jgi:nucleoside-diphosphate-sugar epimerase
VVSVPPDQIGDPVIRLHGDDLRAAARLRWIGYLSTIGVYGDHDGGWVDEDTPANPASDRSQRRLEAEDAWLRLGRDGAGPVQVFRLSGIYGPGRSAIDNLREGTARRIIKPRQVFNRIHVEDIAAVLSAAASGRGAHTVYNVTDDEPAPPQDVIAFAADLLGLPVPEDVPFEAANLSPMAATFYAENKRVRNGRIKSELDVQLKYPSYREGLRAIADMARPSFMDSS